MNTRTWLARVTPRGYLLFALAVVIAFAAVGVWGAGAFGGTRIPASSEGVKHEHRWGGGDLLLEGLGQRPGTCVVRPEQAPEREVAVSAKGGDGVELTSWFTGPALITCDVDAKGYTGTSIGLHTRTRSLAFKIGVPLAVLVPVVLGVVYGVRRDPH
ncbi:hypothetical protein LX15_006381 [Streptoalloteichus tenebrarius]|uniref:Uncharacterized protein n=1 Tax=Streptoalloteichus tenebrarius (strain ATCC 17920 / DSM 40477 / JCM 4838 / CBS 697.72 / NBRC 16177 / NCIMB 11028 / NRRL B-12390 / A12253. 1 / ISP 5477) TaxID=1933 RepID=A0ABT1I4F5_STRSD|nr:hypothetical protein [Streptoalloteichus tenebrarius]MCP2262639.1 hypothetical protein [Streptoalloteichus tenebrarius]BFF02460.1 hypothetical protein GCM10020241_41350 [Streptoalloteichus tenebrarius]